MIFCFTNDVSRPLKRIFSRASFVVCVVVLGVCAGGLKVTTEWLDLNFRKEALPLRKEFSELDDSKLAPYQVMLKMTIPDEIVEELGTEQYLQWSLEDSSVDALAPDRNLVLFITYYTGNPDKVPHVPDECYTGGGGLIKESGNYDLKLPGLGLEGDKLPVRVLDVYRETVLGEAKQTVMYFFAVNGTYRCTRDQVRLLQNNLFDKYAYFSKVEVNFGGSGKMSREENLAGLSKLLEVLLPVLIEEHWPDWDAANNEQLE